MTDRNTEAWAWGLSEDISEYIDEVLMTGEVKEDTERGIEIGKGLLVDAGASEEDLSQFIRNVEDMEEEYFYYGTDNGKKRQENVNNLIKAIEEKEEKRALYEKEYILDECFMWFEDADTKYLDHNQLLWQYHELMKEQEEGVCDVTVYRRTGRITCLIASSSTYDGSTVRTIYYSEECQPRDIYQLYKLTRKAA